MEIVVKIPDDTIKSLEQGNFGAKYNIYDLVGYLMNGTPLPKHHGRLIDEEDMLSVIIFSKLFDSAKVGEVKEALLNIPTIIEADKGSDSE